MQDFFFDGANVLTGNRRVFLCAHARFCALALPLGALKGGEAAQSGVRFTLKTHVNREETK